MKIKKFKEDGKTPRCRESVFHSGTSYGCTSLAGYASQCEHGAKYEDNTRCKRHTKAYEAEQLQKTLDRQIVKARKTLDKLIKKRVNA